MKTVFFLDIDDCLIETSRLGKDELNALETALKYIGINKAEEITREFSQIFHIQYDSHQGKHLSPADLKRLEKFHEKLKYLERDIIKEYGQVKKWSREVFLYAAAEKFGIKLKSGEINQITMALWKAITDHNPFYPDALVFLKTCISENLIFYLISASDCRLLYNEKNNLFTYDPERSRKLKMQRLQKFLDIGVAPENIFIGDPYDKPDPRIFQKALSKARSDQKSPFISVMVGDSINNDLIPAALIGMEELVFINRHRKKVQLENSAKIREIFSLSEIPI